MKKLIAILLALICIFSLVGCKEKDPIMTQEDGYANWEVEIINPYDPNGKVEARYKLVEIYGVGVVSNWQHNIAITYKNTQWRDEFYFSFLYKGERQANYVYQKTVCLYRAVGEFQWQGADRISQNGDYIILIKVFHVDNANKLYPKEEDTNFPEDKSAVNFCISFSLV